LQQINWIRYRLPDIWRKVKRLPYNTYVYRKAIWDHNWYDYTSLLQAMRSALVDMEDSKHKSHTCNWDVHRQDMRVCIHLLDRLIESEYDINKLDFIPDNKSLMGLRTEKKYDLPSENAICRLGHKIREQDLQMLTNILNRKLFSFWD